MALATGQRSSCPQLPETRDSCSAPSCPNKAVDWLSIESYYPGTMQTKTSAPPRAGFDPACFSELAEAEAASFWFKARNKLILWALDQYSSNVKSFLEIGCGTGFVLTA